MAERLTDLEERIERLSKRLDRVEGRLTHAEVNLGFCQRALEELDVRPRQTQRDLLPVGDGQKVAEIVAVVSEARNGLRSAKDSVSGMRRLIDPNDITGAHNVPEKK